MPGGGQSVCSALWKRLPQELRLAITGMAEANRFLKEVYLPQHNARGDAEAQGSAFVPFAGALDDISASTQSASRQRQHRALSSCSSRPTATGHYVGHGQHEYPDGTLAVFHGPRCLARYRTTGEPIDNQTRQAA